MVIYIEYVLIDNIVMNYLIINFIEATLKNKIRKINKFISCLLGGLMTLLLPYFYTKSLLLFVYKIIVSFSMVIILKKYKSLKNFFTYYILFIAYTFLIGGIIFGIINMLQIDYTISGVMFYSFEFPIGIFVVLGLIGVVLGKKVITTLKKYLRESNLLYPIKLFANNLCVEGVGFYDSGNTLNVDGEFVSIISLDMFMRIYTDIPLEKILLRKIDNLRGIRYIDIKGLNSNGSFLSFLIDKMCVGSNEFKNVRVAVAIKNFNKFDCILNSNYIN